MIRIIGSLFAVWGFIALWAALFIATTFREGVMLVALASVLLVVAGGVFMWAHHEDEMVAQVKRNRTNVGQGGGDIVPGWGSGW